MHQVQKDVALETEEMVEVAQAEVDLAEAEDLEATTAQIQQEEPVVQVIFLEERAM